MRSSSASTNASSTTGFEHDAAHFWHLRRWAWLFESHSLRAICIRRTFSLPSRIPTGSLMRSSAVVGLIDKRARRSPARRVLTTARRSTPPSRTIANEEAESEVELGGGTQSTIAVAPVASSRFRERPHGLAQIELGLPCERPDRAQTARERQCVAHLLVPRSRETSTARFGSEPTRQSRRGTSNLNAAMVSLMFGESNATTAHQMTTKNKCMSHELPTVCVRRQRHRHRQRRFVTTKRKAAPSLPSDCKKISSAAMHSRRR